jgi:hypothetical protein
VARVSIAMAAIELSWLLIDVFFYVLAALAFFIFCLSLLLGFRIFEYFETIGE